MSDKRKQIDQLENKVGKITESLNLPSKLSVWTASSIQKKQIPETNSVRFLSTDEVEIGRPDSNVVITADQWDTAKNRNTFIVAGLSLPTAVFDLDALLQRNLKGRCNKINKDAARNKAIDADKLSAIKCKLTVLY